MAATLAGLISVATMPKCHPEAPKFFAALEKVEDGQGKVTDKGKGLGCFCIHRAYWEDACGTEPTLRAFKYEHCAVSRIYSWLVVEAYLRRFCLKAWESGDWETCAKVHHRGPSQINRKAKMAFATRVLNLVHP